MRFRPSPLLLVALGTAACRPGPGGDGPLVDDAGRQVLVPSAPQRIVSLSPGFTELLFALGLGDRVVGRTRFDRDPEAVAAIPSVGDGLNPNLEAVLARRPDFVLLYHSSANRRAVERLEAFGVPSAALRLDGLDDFERVARWLGRLFALEHRADSLLAAFREELTAAAKPAGDRPRVAVLVWDNPPIAIGRASFLSEIVELAGGRNVFDDIPQASAPVSIEVIAARDPDVVLATGESSAFRERPAWQPVRAVRERRIVTVGGSEFAYPSFRTPGAVRRVAAALRQARP